MSKSQASFFGLKSGASKSQVSIPPIIIQIATKAPTYTFPGHSYRVQKLNKVRVLASDVDESSQSVSQNTNQHTLETLSKSRLVNLKSIVESNLLSYMFGSVSLSPNSNPLRQRKQNKGICLTSPNDSNPKTPFQSPVKIRTNTKCSPPNKRTVLTVKISSGQNPTYKECPRKNCLLQKSTSFVPHKQGCLQNHKSVQSHQGQKHPKKKVRFNLEQNSTMVGLRSVQKTAKTPQYSKNTKGPSKSALIPSVRPIDRRDSHSRQRIRIFQHRDNLSPRLLQKFQVLRPGNTINLRGAGGQVQSSNLCETEEVKS